jgi:restriction endonuclease S subunit
VQVFDRQDRLYATVSEVTVIRQSRVNPYYLQFFLQSLAGQLQIERWITGATGQLHLYPRDVEKIIVPILPAAQQLEFEETATKARRIKQEAKQLLEDAKQRVEQMILGEEASHVA